MLAADMSEHPLVRRVMISSTALDLPEHRKHARDACERMSMLPLVMEQMPATPDDALTISRGYVDQADYYLGIFAFRYGFVPEGQGKSITELEYDRALERGIPAFIFIADDEHPVSFRDVEKGAGAPKLEALKERLRNAHVARTFRSAEELRTEIISALSAYRQDDATKLHYIAEIPTPPAPWVAHWYSLLGSRRLVGRRAELNFLTDWVANPSSEQHSARLLALVAIGGMGKTALAWTWFNEIALNEMKPLAGRIWWSFYESDARLENFIARSLAYLTGRPRAETEKIHVRDREDQLVAILDREPHLVVLDGLERELVAYATMDAAHMSDDDLDARTAHQIAGRPGLPAGATQSFLGDAKLRQAADPRAGQLLRRLAQVRAARVLVTTRLLPYDLQDFNGEPLPGTLVRFLAGIADHDALELWRMAGISGAHDALVALFKSFEGHPLLVRTLAGEIARDRRSPGDFEKWREHHPDFNPFALPLVQRKSHVLAYALQGLSPPELALLQAIAAFRMPASYETLAALLVGEKRDRRAPFSSDKGLDRALADLDDRGLVGWDRRANRYDLHPIVRGVVWSAAVEGARRAIAERMREHFDSMPAMDWWEVERLDDLTPAIELYVSLIRLERFDEALQVFRKRLHKTLDRLSATRQQVELLELLFPEGVDRPPRLEREYAYALTVIAQGYQFGGQPGKAVSFLRLAVHIDKMKMSKNLAQSLNHLSSAVRVIGALQAAEVNAARALNSSPVRANEFHVLSLECIGRCRATRGLADNDATLSLAIQIGRNESNPLTVGLVSGLLAESALWRGDPAAARPLADDAWQMVAGYGDERDTIRAARLQGEAALALGDLDVADERLYEALKRARAVNFVEEELAALTALAALHRRRGETARAREHLDAVWNAAERGPYPLLHADARNVLAEIEIHEGNRDAAVAAATAAYRLAWCDGPPFAYDYGLRTARAHLRALGAAEPAMPPYDASKYEPIEEINIGKRSL
jgi:tetratricopeptide (TPR) repeat protein